MNLSTKKKISYVAFGLLNISFLIRLIGGLSYIFTYTNAYNYYPGLSHDIASSVFAFVFVILSFCGILLTILEDRFVNVLRVFILIYIIFVVNFTYSICIGLKTGPELFIFLFFLALLFVIGLVFLFNKVRKAQCIFVSIISGLGFIICFISLFNTLSFFNNYFYSYVNSFYLSFSMILILTASFSFFTFLGIICAIVDYPIIKRKRIVQQKPVIEKTSIEKRESLDDPAIKLEMLKKLYDNGVINKEEYEEKRKKYVDQL